MKVGEIWKSKEAVGRVKILAIETGTIMPFTGEKYNSNAQWIRFKMLDLNDSFDDGCTRERFIQLFEKVYNE